MNGTFEQLVIKFVSDSRLWVGGGSVTVVLLLLVKRLSKRGYTTPSRAHTEQGPSTHAKFDKKKERWEAVRKPKAKIKPKGH